MKLQAFNNERRILRSNQTKTLFIRPDYYISYIYFDKYQPLKYSIILQQFQYSSSSDHSLQELLTKRNTAMSDVISNISCADTEE